LSPPQTANNNKEKRQQSNTGVTKYTAHRTILLQSARFLTVRMLYSVYYKLTFLVLLLFPTRGTASDATIKFPTEITLKAGIIETGTFGGFQLDLLERLERFAEEEGVNLTFEVTKLQDLYTSNLPLIGPECHEGESVVINDMSYNCSDYDMIVGDYWPNPE
jgi:hypothetical protein